MLFRAHWIKSKILHSICLRLYHYYTSNLSVCMCSDLSLAFIFSHKNAATILIYSAIFVSCSSSGLWLYLHSSICLKEQVMNPTLGSFGLPEWVIRRSTSNTNKSLKNADSGPVHNWSFCLLRAENIIFGNVSRSYFKGFLFGHLYLFIAIILATWKYYSL
jgi:hypothetical protein